MNKNGKVLISASILQGIRGVLLLREAITEVCEKAITKRIGKEISSCTKSKSEHSHWLEQVLPGRIATTLAHPHHDYLLNSGNTLEFKARLHQILSGGGGSCSFYFEIMERYLLVKLHKRHGDSNLVELIFCENSAENPDKNLQEILLKVLEERVDIMSEE